MKLKGKLRRSLIIGSAIFALGSCSEVSPSEKGNTKQNTIEILSTDTSNKASEIVEKVNQDSFEVNSRGEYFESLSGVSDFLKNCLNQYVVGKKFREEIKKHGFDSPELLKGYCINLFDERRQKFYNKEFYNKTYPDMNVRYIGEEFLRPYKKQLENILDSIDKLASFEEFSKE